MHAIKKVAVLVLTLIIIMGCFACSLALPKKDETGDPPAQNTPVQPSEPTEPTTPSNPTAPINPSNPTTPSNPTAPSEPEVEVDETSTIYNYRAFPVIKMTFNLGAPMKKEEGYKTGTISTENCLVSEIIDEAVAEVKVRGNSTAEAKKKPYRIKFEKKQSMFSLNEGQKYKSWVLLADAYDYSMMRNYFIYKVGSVFNNTYCTDCRHVSLYINGQYQGVYLLAEQNQVNEGRIEIDEANLETSANTGIFVEADSRAASDGCVRFRLTTPVSEIDPSKEYYIKVKYMVKTTQYEQLFTIKSDLSSDKEIAHAQLTRILNYMQSVYDALFNYSDEATVRSLIDIPSAVDMFIINNIASLRGGKRSDFYYIDFSKEQPRLCFGPPWDYDLDCGNYDVADLPTEFQALKISDYVNYTLNQRPWFVSLVKERWQEVSGGAKLRELLKQINPQEPNAICNYYQSEFNRNYDKWNIWGTKTVSFLRNDVTKFRCHTDAVQYFYNWMETHVDYADSVWGA